jgi:hypothetical protein
MVIALQLLLPAMIIIRNSSLLVRNVHPRLYHRSAPTLLSMNSIEKDFSNPKKFVIVTGGVISGIGKGITASSIGVVLKMMGLRPTALKIDPYLNVDAGTM